MAGYAEAPSRNEKWLWLWSSAYPATRRGLRGAGGDRRTDVRSVPARNGNENRRDPTKPEPGIARLMRVIADPTLHSRRFVAVEVALRAVEIAAVAVLVLWVLPVIADTAR